MSWTSVYKDSLLELKDKIINNLCKALKLSDMFYTPDLMSFYDCMPEDDRGECTQSLYVIYVYFGNIVHYSCPVSAAPIFPCPSLYVQ